MHLRLRLCAALGLALGCGSDGDGDDDDAGTTGGGPTTMSSPTATSADPDTTGVVDGEPIAIDNAGFEMPTTAPGGLNISGPPPGWSLFDPDGIINGMENSVGVLNPMGTPLFPNGAPEGSNVALVFLWQTQGTPVGLTQVLGDSLVAGATYTLGVDVGNIAVGSAAPYDLAGFPGYRVELRAGDAVLASDQDGVSPAEGAFERITISYTAAAGDPVGQPLEIRLVNLSRPDSGIEVNFDDVQLHVSPS
jgi:hypothetical protein